MSDDNYPFRDPHLHSSYLKMLSEMLDSTIEIKYGEDGSVEGLTSNGKLIVKAHEEPANDRSHQKKPTKVNKRCRSKKS